MSPSHLLQVFLQHLHHGFQFGYLPLQPDVTLTEKQIY